MQKASRIKSQGGHRDEEKSLKNRWDYGATVAGYAAGPVVSGLLGQTRRSNVFLTHYKPKRKGIGFSAARMSAFSGKDEPAGRKKSGGGVIPRRER